MNKQQICDIIKKNCQEFGMKYRTLYDMIKYIQYGTNLHIGALFLNNYGNEMCRLPFTHTIHSSPVCEFIKATNKNEYNRCFKCRNLQ